MNNQQTSGETTREEDVLTDADHRRAAALQVQRRHDRARR